MPYRASKVNNSTFNVCLETDWKPVWVGQDWSDMIPRTTDLSVIIDYNSIYRVDGGVLQRFKVKLF